MFLSKTFSKFLMATAVAVVGFISAQAHAEYFAWQDRLSEVSVTYPDRWQSIHTQKPDEVLHIVAPGDENFASCRIRAHDDGRFKIHRKAMGDEIQRLNVSKDFWMDYVNQYDHGHVISVTDNAGLGPGFASYADMSYVTEVGPRVFKRGFAFATIHYDKMYIFECSSAASVYDQWRDPFLSILKSVDIAPFHSQYLNGYYRNFPADGNIVIKGVKETDTFIY